MLIEVFKSIQAPFFDSHPRVINIISHSQNWFKQRFGMLPNASQTSASCNLLTNLTRSLFPYHHFAVNTSVPGLQCILMVESTMEFIVGKICSPCLHRHSPQKLSSLIAQKTVERKELLFPLFNKRSSYFEKLSLISLYKSIYIGIHFMKMLLK
jgi:hypothetical protein